MCVVHIYLVSCFSFTLLVILSLTLFHIFCVIYCLTFLYISSLTFMLILSFTFLFIYCFTLCIILCFIFSLILGFTQLFIFSFTLVIMLCLVFGLTLLFIYSFILCIALEIPDNCILRKYLFQIAVVTTQALKVLRCRYFRMMPLMFLNSTLVHKHFFTIPTLMFSQILQVCEILSAKGIIVQCSSIVQIYMSLKRKFIIELLSSRLASITD